MLAEAPRLVTVYTKTDNGLYSSIPPILLVCSESRAIGLRHYSLAFTSQSDTLQRTVTPEHMIDVLPPGVYFNFERDTFYFRENWNKNVKGAWSCLSQFSNLVKKDDLKRVKRIGFDVNTSICSLKTSGTTCHFADLAFWDALENMYLGYEDIRLGSNCPISSSELKSEYYEDFIQRYKMNPCWEPLGRGNEAIEYLRNKVHRYGKKPDQLLKKLELVNIKHL
jgi:2EXR family